jgi:hypothetical protein
VQKCSRSFECQELGAAPIGRGKESMVDQLCLCELCALSTFDQKCVCVCVCVHMSAFLCFSNQQPATSQNIFVVFQLAASS